MTELSQTETTFPLLRIFGTLLCPLAPLATPGKENGDAQDRSDDRGSVCARMSPLGPKLRIESLCQHPYLTQSRHFGRIDFVLGPPDPVFA